MFYIRPILALKFSINFRKAHQILGVSTTASFQQIKTAYYRLAKIYHPDMNPEPTTAAKFDEIQNAYQQLSNQHKQNPNARTNKKSHSHSNASNKSQNKGRRTGSYSQFDQYDDFWGDQEEDGDEYFSEKSTQLNDQDFKNFQKAFSSFIRNGYLKKKYRKYESFINQLFTSNLNKGKSYYEEDISDFYQNARHKQKTKKQSTAQHRKVSHLDIILKLKVRQEELGVEQLIEFEREVSCHRCTFEKQKNYVKKSCRYCDRSGLDNKLNICKHCNGKGFFIKYDCKECKNTNTIMKKVKELIMLPESIEFGDKIVLKGRGNQNIKKGNYGDLILELILQNSQTQVKHKRKTASTNDLFIDIYDAVLGKTSTLRSVHGQTTIRIPAGTQDGDIIHYQYKKVKGKKIQKNWVRINISIPNNLSQKEKSIYQKIRQIKEKQIFE